MPGVTFTKESLIGSKALKPTWYTMEIQEGVREFAAKTDGSTNWSIDLKILDGPDAGVKVSNMWNEKDFGMMQLADFLKCFTGGNNDSLVGKGVKETLESLKGRKISGFIKYDSERKQNSIVDWKPVGK